MGVTPELSRCAIDLLAVCSTTDDLVVATTAQQPDTVLVDLNSSVTLDTLAELRRAAPAAKIILWVEDISLELAFQAMEIGCRAVLRKSLPPEMIVKCIAKVYAGELWFEKALTDQFLDVRRIALAPREGRLIEALARGLKNKEIAYELLISPGTVKVYMSRLFQKLGVKDRWELAIWALRNMSNGHGTLTAVPKDRRYTLRSIVIPRIPA
jgi:DNA-binding NarL/FixJ family response regulator